jgi:hypothetical protein
MPFCMRADMAGRFMSTSPRAECGLIKPHLLHAIEPSHLDTTGSPDCITFVGYRRCDLRDEGCRGRTMKGLS